MSRHDLVVVALSGVQRLITESRRTTDLASGSDIVTSLARTAVKHLQGIDAKMIFPADPDAPAGIPNKIVALLPEGQGEAAAAGTEEKLKAIWREWIRDTFQADLDPDPGWPAIQWVCAPASVGDYPTLWEEAQRALQHRKTVHDAQQAAVVGVGPCELSPRWSAVPADRAPTKAIPRETGDLSVNNWVKRLWHRRARDGGFPPTNAIASAHYRAAVLRAADEDAEVRDLVQRLYDAACGVWEEPQRDPVVAGMPPKPSDPALDWMRRGAGLWVYPENWEEASVRNRLRKEELPVPSELNEAVADGRAAASALVRQMATHGVPRPSAYLAVLAQDLDSMGDFLSGDGNRKKIEVSADTHTEVSTKLQEEAQSQFSAVGSETLKGNVVYAGGDDFFALVPAATALDAALVARKLVDDDRTSASTAVHFFHHAAPLQSAIEQARRALERAKGFGRKNGLAVSYTTASGSAELCRRPWGPKDTASVEDFTLFKQLDLSPRLVWDLDSALDQLSTLTPETRRAELKRLIRRHLTPAPGTNEEQALNSVLAALDRLRPPDQSIALNAVKVSLFLSREARQ